MRTALYNAALGQLSQASPLPTASCSAIVYDRSPPMPTTPCSEAVYKRIPNTHYPMQ